MQSYLQLQYNCVTFCFQSLPLSYKICKQKLIMCKKKKQTNKQTSNRTKNNKKKFQVKKPNKYNHDLEELMVNKK